jgi:PAS domain S-box-containing protein
MRHDSTVTETHKTPSFAPRLYGIGLLVAAIVITGLWLVGRFTDIDLARDTQTWQEKLNLIAESRVDDVDHWVGENFKELRTLADNPSLQLYMTELQMQDGAEKNAHDDTAAAEPSQKAYLRNLLLFTAQRSGFGASGAATGIPANVKPANANGLAIVGSNNEILVSTVMQPDTRDEILKHVKDAAAGQEALIDIQVGKDGVPYIGFVVPIYSIQGDRNAASQIGRVIGIKTLEGNLFGLLKHPGTTEKTLETILVRSKDDKIEYISPLQDETEAMGKTVPLDTAHLAEAMLVQSVGNFVSDGVDYRNKKVLATSRSVAGTPWTMIVKIDKQEALGPSGQRRAGMAVFFFLIIAIIVLIVVATWWRAHSRRSLLMSGHFRRLAARAQAQEQLLRLVADNQPEPIYIVDTHQVLHFANQQATTDANMSSESVAGKSLRDVRGAARADHIAEQCEKALKGRQVSYDLERTVINGEQKVIRSAYVPLEHIPVVSLPAHTPGVLIVEQDISEVMHERERRVETQRQLIETLVMLVDKRDPFASNHSQLVAQIAYAIAGEMELNNTTAETTSIAGSLMNIGKIVVPTELLTKTGVMTPEEKRIVRDSMNEAADVLKTVDFDGPVAETLRQWQEKWDGSGPLGMKGESILISARIIAVANAFIGMISPRAWREAIEMESATKTLLDQSGKQFDRRAVIALVNFVENHSGKEWLSKMLAGKKGAA